MTDTERLTQNSFFEEEPRTDSQKNRRRRKRKRETLTIEQQVAVLEQMRTTLDMFARSKPQHISEDEASGRGLQQMELFFSNPKAEHPPQVFDVSLGPQMPERAVIDDIIYQLERVLETGRNLVLDKSSMPHYRLITDCLSLDLGHKEGTARRNFRVLIRALYFNDLGDSTRLEKILPGEGEDLFNLNSIKVGRQEVNVDTRKRMLEIIKRHALISYTTTGMHRFRDALLHYNLPLATGPGISPTNYTKVLRHLSVLRQRIVLRHDDHENDIVIESRKLLGTIVHRSVQWLLGNYFAQEIQAGNGPVLNNQVIPISPYANKIFDFSAPPNMSVARLDDPLGGELYKILPRPSDYVKWDLIKTALDNDAEIYGQLETEQVRAAFAYFAAEADRQQRKILKAQYELQKSGEENQEVTDAVQAIQTLISEMSKNPYNTFVRPLLNALVQIHKLVNLNRISWQMEEIEGSPYAIPKFYSEIPATARLFSILPDGSDLTRHGLNYTKLMIDCRPDLVAFEIDDNNEEFIHIIDWKIGITNPDILQKIAFMYAIVIAAHAERYVVFNKEMRFRNMDIIRPTPAQMQAWRENPGFAGFMHRLLLAKVSFVNLHDPDSEYEFTFTESDVHRLFDELAQETEILIYYEELLKSEYSNVV